MRYAIIIGINDYVNARELNYCAKDAEDIENTFVNFCNVQSDNVRLIISSIKRPQANPWNTFKEVIDELKTKFEPNVDDLLFYFSGHGKDSNQTTVIFKNETKNVSEIIEEIENLTPKTKVLIFDSCHSGAGYIETEKSAQFFSLSSKATTGYYIISACTKEQTAKESKALENGKFTRFFINTISDKQNYNQYNYFDINSLFSKVDTFLKSHPEYEQTPFQQIKSVGSYPIANNFNDEHCYVRFDIETPNDFEWGEFIKTLNIYLKTKESVIGEFSRLVREQFDNTSNPVKGDAKIQSIEITKNKVCLVDNGKYFDLFNPQSAVKAGGGIKTAKMFQEEFKDYFTYHSKEENGINAYEYIFSELSIGEVCSMFVTWSEISSLREKVISIDEVCETYTIRFEKYTVIISVIFLFIQYLKGVAQNFNKIIYIELHENDRIIKDAEHAIETYDAKDWVKIKTYKD
jgi:hypothetical protein